MTPSPPSETLAASVEDLLYDPAEFRVQLLLLLPELAQINPGTGYLEPDHDYNAAALAEWILDQFARARAAAQAEAEYATAEVIEMAGAAAVINASVEFARYATQLAEVLKRGLGLAEQWDLARTIDAEAHRLLGVAGNLVTRYPALTAQVLPPDLQAADGSAL